MTDALGTYLAGIASVKSIAILGEASGTTSTDTSGKGHNLTWNNAPTWGQTALYPGGATCALLAPASSQTAQAADHADFDVGANDLWFHLLFKTSTNDTMWAMNKGDHDGGIDVSFDGVQWNWYFGNSVVAQSNTHGNTAWRDGAAHQLIGNAVRAGNATYYRDGTANGTPADISSRSAISYNNANKYEIGSRLDSGNSALYWNGNLGYVAFGIGATLTTQQIADLYTIFSTGSLPGATGPAFIGGGFY